MIYFSFVGNHDALKENQLGALFTIFLANKDDIDKVFIFITPSKTDDKVDYYKIAEQNKRRIVEEKPSASVQFVKIDIDNPIDFDLVYPELLAVLNKIIDQNDLQNSPSIINITSGSQQ